jgi:hypothetical protein
MRTMTFAMLKRGKQLITPLQKEFVQPFSSSNKF